MCESKKSLLYNVLDKSQSWECPKGHVSHQKASYSCAIGVNRERDPKRYIYKREAGTPLTSLAVCRLTKKAVGDDLPETAFSRIAIRDNMASIHPTDYYCCYVLLSREMMKHLRAFVSIIIQWRRTEEGFPYDTIFAPKITKKTLKFKLLKLSDELKYLFLI